MSQKIPFLQMFSALRQWTELTNGVERWVIVSAAVDRSSRSAKIVVEGAAGAGPNLIAQAEEALCLVYQLKSVWIEAAEPTAQEEPKKVNEDKNSVDDSVDNFAAEPGKPLEDKACGDTVPKRENENSKPESVDDAFARTEALRAKRLQSVKRAAPSVKAEKKPQGKAIFGKLITKAAVPIGELELDMGTVVVEGDVFAVDNRELKKRGAWVVAFDMTDYTGSIRINRFFAGDEGKPLVDGIKKGLHVKVQGRLNMDRFYGDMVLEPVAVTLGEKKMRQDTAPEKRVELHLHTSLSTMDALTAVGPKLGPDRNVVKRAEAWGHPAIAITDHGVAQAFPEAWHSAKNIKILYGVEAYFINDLDDRVAVHGESEANFSDEIVCFDIETTGLNRKYEVIIEIGAVVLKNGEITDRFNTFVSPGRMLSPQITQLTGITDQMLEGAPSQKEALRAFLEFAGDRPLAAHNADFDMGFIAAGCEKYKLPFHNPSVDSLILAQNLLPELGRYKLDIVAEYLHLPAFNHHRASDDAATVAYMLPHFFQELESAGLEKLSQINPYMLQLRGKGKVKRRPKHLIVLAKNQTGLRNLYKLVSLAHLEHFKRYPIMPKSLINENREGLIIGSACEAGELFQALADGRSWEELKRIASWYDYLEIQPICNNMFMVRKGEKAKTESDLRDFNRAIVRLGEELGKPVCATGDVHFLDPEDEIYRHILLASKGFEDADEPLPIYFKTTDEMLKEFSYLGKEKAHEVVVKNTNLIASWCDPIEPLPKGLFAPKLEDSDGELKRLVWGKAHELYGENPPQIVVDRIEAELGDIIRCKYDVIYMSAQKLVQNSLEHGYLVGSRGSVGSSLVAFMSGITEVNSLPAHYRCPNCKHTDFDYAQDPEHPYGCGADMPDAVCPVCGTRYVKDGFNIPFETFLGFGGDKVPDIDLNFSGEYQSSAHRYTFELFGQTHVFRAGTIGTVAEKTAFGYVKKYLAERGLTASKAEENRLAIGCTGVKRTTGQHPGGMVVIPQDKEIYDFCPVQHPADDPDSDIITTHFEYHSMESNLLKLDMLGHDDPTMIRMLEDLTGVNAREIPLDDPDTMSLFSSSKALGYEDDKVLGPTGGTAIPEFGTSFVRGMLEETQPNQFDILVRLSGFSHGTDVWLGNARDLILSGTAKVNQAIGCRDDIMLFLISKGMDPKRSFKIMEAVRKGRGLPEGAEDEMKAAGVPDWYIGSCKKIAYLFPKAHAVAYVMMAFRIAWFKVHRPLAFYAAYFSIRAKAFDEAFMCRGMEVCRKKMREIVAKDKDASQVEKDMLTTLEVCYEFYLRGYQFERMDIYRSKAIHFTMDEERGTLRPPFVSVAGLGETAAISLEEQSAGKEFISIEEVSAACPKVSKTHIELLKDAGAFGNLPETSQMDLFSMFG
ncbi:PolC-type DNA polymerase III [Pseudoflavonifractor sp. 60]|uniref:PolC-type DNA polymerase III n=1 Tax=Pseudoflavonifractor sp. 60 TaxID=2304576 RepID=UPI00136E192D|nr:PolC-type DNA polymerase III [Pseudoflavonifractor sp. 60]NBI66809.1 PolC-type DNA polymerase III [Pseudoflavonifractor sp. 60]